MLAEGEINRADCSERRSGTGPVQTHDAVGQSGWQWQGAQSLQGGVETGG